MKSPGEPLPPSDPAPGQNPGSAPAAEPLLQIFGKSELSPIWRAVREDNDDEEAD